MFPAFFKRGVWFAEVSPRYPQQQNRKEIKCQHLQQSTSKRNKLRMCKQIQIEQVKEDTFNKSKQKRHQLRTCSNIQIDEKSIKNISKNPVQQKQIKTIKIKSKQIRNQLCSLAKVALWQNWICSPMFQKRGLVRKVSRGIPSSQIEKK